MNDVTLEVLRKLPVDAMVSYGAWKRQFLAEHPDFLTEVKGLDWYLIDLWASHVRINELEEALNFNTRAAKLSLKRKPFIVVANDEPYFMRVYAMIRSFEMVKGRWNDADEQAFRAAISGKETTISKPTVVCLCGSTRFIEAYRDANLAETIAGRIVLSIGCDMRSDAELFGDRSRDELDDIKARLDELHKRKIDLADEILVLNVGGYVGESTRGEIEYAQAHGKRVRWLEPVGESEQKETHE